MLQFIYSQIIFYAAIALVMFVPGYFLLSAIFRKSRIISSLEKFILSFGLSIVSVDFIFFAFDKMEFPITRFSILSGIAVFSAVSFLVYKMGKTGSETDETGKLFDFSKKQFGLIILLIFLMFFIKTAYLSGTVFPTSTDMGHHMYWAKWMVENNQLPTYDGMPDFIIGEHTVFGALAILGSLDFFSAFPPAMLFLINILGILTVFILTLRIFKNKTIAILSLLFLGVLFAVSSPQAKFISGGVVGNIFGNFLMPLALYLYFRAFEFINLPEKGISAASQKRFLALAIFVTFGLFYTHHLTSFIFLFVFAFLAGLFLLLNFTDIKVIIPRIFRLVFSPQVMSVLLIGIVFMFFVFTPTYFENNAVNTAVGAPSKSTREGLSLSALKSSIGEARLAFGFLGLLLLAFAYKRRNFGYAVVSAWAAMIFIMSSVPQVLFINLPSNRIGNYLSYPFAILSAYALYSVFRKDSQGNFSEKTLIRSAFILVFVFVLAGGILESAREISRKNDTNQAVQTFHAAKFVAERTGSSDVILKDHNYISADSWMKLFFMRGYRYPDSRGYFKRYEDLTKPREMCTLWMISNPGGKDAEDCFDETGTRFLMVNPQYDSAQFRKLSNFDQIYSGDKINIYHKND